LRINCGDRRGDFNIKALPFSFSGDGEDPAPDAEFRRDDPIRTSKCRKRSVVVSSLFELLNKKAKGQEIHDDSLQKISNL
jgi:hypothetical protein